MQKRQEEGGVPQQRGLSSQAGFRSHGGTSKLPKIAQHLTILVLKPIDLGDPPIFRNPQIGKIRQIQSISQLFGVWNGKFSREFGGSEGMKPSH